MIPRYRNAGAPFVALLLLIFFSLTPGSARSDSGGGAFRNYPEDVRLQAERVVAAAKPGNGRDLKAELRLLGKRMHSRALLSLNAIPEQVFLEAKRGGWLDHSTDVMRPLTEVAPLSVPLWAWLFKEDLVHLRLPDAIRDFGGMAGAVRRFGPALLGYGAWLVTYLVAAFCWFAAWASVALFLRGRPSLEADLKRLLKVPYREYLAPIFAFLLFVLPLSFGFGLAVATCVWLALSTVYLRRTELVMMTVAVFMLAGLVAGGGLLHSFEQVGGNIRKGGWLGGEGFIPDQMPDEGATLFSPDVAWMLEFARARLDMQTGRAAAAERRFGEILQTGKTIPEVYNNRGIARALQGKTQLALDDFETAMKQSPGDGPSMWNAYQIHLSTFNLEKAGALQAGAWAGIQALEPFGFRPAEFEQGEWIASGLPVSEIWIALLRSWEDLVRDAGRSEVFHKFFHPMTPFGALVFLGIAYVWSMVWKAASLKLWVNCTCRVCGTRSMIIASRETSDICTPCRAQIGDGIRAGEERDRRVQGIQLHRRFVRLASIFVPGSGALWAGKELRTFVFGLLLAASLGGVTSSLGIAAEGNPIVYDLQRSVLAFFAASSLGLWIFGAAWGLISFDSLQRRFNLIGGR